MCPPVERLFLFVATIVVLHQETALASFFFSFFFLFLFFFGGGAVGREWFISVQIFEGEGSNGLHTFKVIEETGRMGYFSSALLRKDDIIGYFYLNFLSCGGSGGLIISAQRASGRGGGRIVDTSVQRSEGEWV